MVSCVVVFPPGFRGPGSLLLPDHVGAILVVFMTVGGIEVLFQGYPATRGEAESIGSPGDDLVLREKATDDLHVLVVLSAQNDRGAGVYVFEIEVLDEDTRLAGGPWTASRGMARTEGRELMMRENSARIPGCSFFSSLPSSKMASMVPA